VSADADELVRIGAVTFLVGLVCVAAAVIPLFFGAHDLPTALNVAAGVLPPLGFGIALYGLVRAARRVRPQDR
jgi:peptidoglycan/LPS O-acetylase OafA/YrhL